MTTDPKDAEQARKALRKAETERCSNFDKGAVFHWAEKGAYVLKADAQAEIARLNRDIERWKTNSRETWRAMQWMRDSINEHVPMPSTESDLLQGPESSVFCDTVARAVISEVLRLTAERDAALAQVAGDSYRLQKQHWFVETGWVDGGGIGHWVETKQSVEVATETEAKALQDQWLVEGKLQHMPWGEIRPTFSYGLFRIRSVWQDVSPSDALAALSRRDAQMRAEGMRKAVEVADRWQADENKPMTMRASILAAAEKEAGNG